MDRQIIIAIDFDDTIVESNFPTIVKEMPNAIKIIKELQDTGYFIILWTCRNGRVLDEAVEWLAERDVVFDSVNNNSPRNLKDYSGLVAETGEGRKIFADTYIDDKNVGGFIGWDKIRDILLPCPKKQVL